ncbi:chromosomal replication initiator protein DnaA [Desulfobacterales bacterium HSG2]|nr:chromosomal replication initiator protein DnaA [Desulfobacterales bacterium HSG2]
MKNIWERAKAAIKESIPGYRYRMWVEPLEFKEEKEGTVILSCPNLFTRKRVMGYYESLIDSELKGIAGKDCNFLIEVLEKKASEKKRAPKRKRKLEKAEDPQMSLPDIHQSAGRFLRKEFTFDRFVVGGSNDFAYSAALSLAEQKDPNQSSLYLLSETGMGKSHLSQAIGHHILSNSPSDRVYYITAEDFMNEMVHALQNNSIDQFKEKFRNKCDVLLLEDVHFLTGKARTQTELAFSLDYLLDADKKIIFTSCFSPAEIPKINEQLRSRFSSSLISGIETPDFKTRVKILRKKAMEQRVKVPNSVTDYLASELLENVRQLESGLIGVTAKASLLGKSIDLGLAESVVKNIVHQKRTVTIEVIKELVCKHYNITLKDITSRSRKKSVVWPRQMAIYLSRRYTDQPLQFIGKSFNRYHATIIHSIAAVEKGLKYDAVIRKQVRYLCGKLESGKF